VGVNQFPQVFTRPRAATYLTLTEGQTPDADVLAGLSRRPVNSQVLQSAAAHIRETQWRWAWRDRDLLEGVESSTLPNMRPPQVLDPFAGTGVIPTEAMNLGCNAAASDLDPIAYHILKANLDYPPRFGHPDTTPSSAGTNSTWRGLRDELEACARQVEKHALARVDHVFPGGGDTSPPRYYFWLMTGTCSACQRPYSLQPSMRLAGARITRFGAGPAWLEWALVQRH
jgi:adenine-specific DNA methylase